MIYDEYHRNFALEIQIFCFLFDLEMAAASWTSGADVRRARANNTERFVGLMRPSL